MENQHISSVKMTDGSVYKIKDTEAREVATGAKTAIDNLANIANSGSILDLIQNEGDVLILDCGGAE